MKKFAAIVAILALLGGALLFSSVPRGGGLIGMFMDEDTRELYKLAKGFLEAIQYKDFKHAATFHNKKDQEKVNIGQLIERLFKIKPEFLNIRDLEVTRVTIDSSGKRARTFFTSNVEFLNSLQGKKQKERKHNDNEGVLYWHKENGEWKLKLESSLRGK